MDCSLPGSSIQSISQARILEWVAIAFSGGSSQPRDWTWVPCIVCKFLAIEPLGPHLVFCNSLNSQRNTWNSLDQPCRSSEQPCTLLGFCCSSQSVIEKTDPWPKLGLCSFPVYKPWTTDFTSMLQPLLQILQIRLDRLLTCKLHVLYTLCLLVIGECKEVTNWEATRVQSPSSGQID